MLPLLSLEVNLEMFPLDTAVITNMQTDILILTKKVLVYLKKRQDFTKLVSFCDTHLPESLATLTLCSFHLSNI